jgi:hypothetical protein
MLPLQDGEERMYLECGTESQRHEAEGIRVSSVVSRITMPLLTWGS